MYKNLWFQYVSSGRSLGWRLAMNQLCASLSLFVNEGFALPEPQGPIQLTLEDSILKSVSTAWSGCFRQKLPYHFVPTI